MSEKRRIARNTLINYARTILTYGVRLFTMPIVLNHLGASEYGTLILVGSIMESSTLAQGGLGVPITKYVADRIATNDRDGLNRLVNSAFMVFLATGALIVLALLVFVLFFMNRVFNIPPTLRHPALVYALIMVALFGVNHVANLFGRLVEGAQRYDIQFAVDVIGLLAGPVATAIVVTRGGGLIEIGVTTGTLSLVGFIVTITLALRAVPQYSFSLSGADMGEVKAILPFSWRVFMTKVASYLSDRFNPWIVGAMLPVAALTPYNIADRIHGLARMPAGVTAITVLPITSGLDATDQKDRIATLFLKGVKYTAAISLPIIMAGIVLTEPVIRYWLGPKFVVAAPLTRIYLSYLVIQLMVPVSSQILVGMGKLDKALIRWILAATGLNIVLSVILVQRIGVAGVIWGSVVGNSIIWLILTSRVLRELRLTARRLVVQSLAPAYLPAVVVYAALWYVAERIPPSGIVATVLYGAAAMAVYEIAILFVALEEPERRGVSAVARSVLGRLTGRG